MISLLVITPDSNISKSIGIHKTSLIPRDIRQKHQNISIASYVVPPSATLEELANYFIRMPRHVSGVVVLCDNRCAHLTKHLSTPLFTIIIDHKLGGKTLHNYLGIVLSRVLRAFASFADRFDNEKYRKLLILPLRNFCAEEITELHSLFKNGVKPDGNFNNSLDQILKRLRERQKPKEESYSQKTYVVDAKDRFFEYGKEIHCQLESSVPPHSHFCGVTGIFRFGKRYDPTRHFNVSLEHGRISGTFEDCHSMLRDAAPHSHINMFPNDFFGTN